MEMFTKTQAAIMQVFVSKINEKFSIKQVSELIKKPYPLIHRSMQDLISSEFIVKDTKGFLELNYKDNHADLAYIEYLRAKQIISKNKSLMLFEKEAINSIKDDFFIFMIFG